MKPARDAAKNVAGGKRLLGRLDDPDVAVMRRWIEPDLKPHLSRHSRIWTIRTLHEHFEAIAVRLTLIMREVHLTDISDQALVPVLHALDTTNGSISNLFRRRLRH